MEELISLSRKELDKLSVIERVKRGALSQVDAGLLINRSTRRVRRLLVRYRKQGEQGLISRRRDKPSNNRLSNSRRLHQSNHPSHLCHSASSSCCVLLPLSLIGLADAWRGTAPPTPTSRERNSCCLGISGLGESHSNVYPLGKST